MGSCTFKPPRSNPYFLQEILPPLQITNATETQKDNEAKSHLYYGEVV